MTVPVEYAAVGDPVTRCTVPGRLVSIASPVFRPHTTRRPSIVGHLLVGSGRLDVLESISTREVAACCRYSSVFAPSMHAPTYGRNVVDASLAESINASAPAASLMLSAFAPAFVIAPRFRKNPGKSLNTFVSVTHDAPIGFASASNDAPSRSSVTRTRPDPILSTRCATRNQDPAKSNTPDSQSADASDPDAPSPNPPTCAAPATPHSDRSNTPHNAHAPHHAAS